MNMKVKITIACCLLTFVSIGLSAQVPFVYNKENTGAACTKPPLPTIDQLPVIQPFPDPFIFNTPGKGRSTSFSDWACRRNEIKQQIENYEIGLKPDRPDSIKATFTRGTTAGTGTLMVVVTKNGQTLTLTSAVSFPATVNGPWPAVIGMNSPSGSIPSTIFTSRNIARITFSHNNVTTYGSPKNTDPFYRLYPDQNIDNAGQYSAWAWGVSRLIDGLEMVQDSLPIDLKHIAVTGCSYAGKMALYSGAFDERVALTIAQESGGGGAPSWRVSHNIEPNGSVEKIDNTDYNWFKTDMRQFSGDNVYKLPEDHHELIAMCAPRAVLVTGNTDFVWLSNKSCYISARAAKETFKTLGISDRMGFYIDGGHGHCAVPNSQLPAIGAFVDKFLLDKTDVITDTVTVNPFPGLDYMRWYKWWGTGNPVLPPPPPEPFGIRILMEAECATVGSDWQNLTDTTASNRKYLVVNGLNSTSVAPAATGQIVFPFTIDSASKYNLYARINCPTANDDSYWIKVDNGSFTTYNNLTTTGWQWTRLISDINLSVGQHTITFGYREDGAKLDKIMLTTTQPNLTAKGSEGSNCGQPPSIVPNQVFAVSELAFKDSTFGKPKATDPDAATEFQNWRIVGGTGASAFAIDAETGALSVKDSSSFDFESATGSYTLMLTVTDGYFKSGPESITINLTNVNDNTPAVSQKQVFSLDGGTCSQLGMVKATDPDDANLTGFTTFQDWQMTGGTGTGIFAINHSTGMITIANLQHVDLYNSNYTLMVTVSDGVHTSAPQTVMVTIPDKITVCHKGQLISVSKMAAIGHLQHGDCIGTCGNQAGTTRLSSDAILQAEGVRVYPNPVTDQLNIDLGTNSLHIRSIELIDLMGRTVLQVKVQNSVVKVPKGSLTTGTYILQLKGDKLLSKQVTVQ
jgi:hypothetical protein